MVQTKDEEDDKDKISGIDRIYGGYYLQRTQQSIEFAVVHELIGKRGKLSECAFLSIPKSFTIFWRRQTIRG